MAEADLSPRALHIAGEQDAPAQVRAPEQAVPDKRRRNMMIMFSVPLLIAAIGAYFWLTSGRFVSTDNAYVKQDVVAVTSDITGKVIDVRVKENQVVRKGELLFRIDPDPYRVALEAADAAMAQAQVKVVGLQTDLSTSAVDIEGAQSDVAFAQAEYERQQELMQRGFTTKAKLQAAQNAYQNAQWRVREAQVDARKAQAALATGSQVPGVNPAVAAAKAQRDKAALDLSRTSVYAPFAGRVSQSDGLQLGKMLLPGLPALSLVAGGGGWVEANFKETQLDHVRPGQSATVRFDAYPGLELKGHVQSIGQGTGSEFSVLPAQNANGNWVKVTQRVPVRIAIDDTIPRQMIAGLSAEVTIDIRDHGDR